ncbi:hypothetical protein [Steroidobacter cummioxidans]|uniref:hypothetical protein n=1 Tax=Steroidobacter cummioxidans TaxID=1803913 RepID=UPI000E3150BF|nr:hypothetical protein [Steroidobacter cummioxidans]
MKVFHRAALASLCVLALSDAQAALLANAGQVTGLRVEGPYAFITMAQSLGPNCGNRYWLDVNSANGKAAYATAMMAFSMDLTVHLRVDDAGARVFGECGLWDIFVSK